MGLGADLALALDPLGAQEVLGEVPGRSSPVAYGRKVLGPFWRDAPHLALLDEALVRAATTPGSRLLVMMPPRHFKSWTTSRFLPGWYVGTFPQRRVILTSYEADFAAQWGRMVRDDLTEHGPDLFGIRLRDDTRASNRWNVEGAAGGMQTAGVGGPITGKGANLLIVDDPIKNDEEAMSPVKREKAWNWWLATAQTRLEPGASAIGVMTRWHEDDLFGRLTTSDEGGGPWEVLRLPALAEEDDPLGRKVGAALDPSRYDEEALAKIRQGLGAFWWASLYQQRPQPAGGGIFRREWMRYWELITEPSPDPSKPDLRFFVMHRPTGPHRIAEKDCWKFATVDPAASEKETADYTVVSIWAVTPEKDLILLDRIRGRFAGPDQVKLIRSAYDLWRPAYIGAESHAYQLTLVQWLRREGLPVRELRADKDKVARSLTAAARYEAGQVYHPKGRGWLVEFEDELLAFPKGAHDDQVDTVSYAAITVASGAFAKAQHGESWWD